MQLKTHIAIGFAIAFYFLPHMRDKPVFFPAVLVASVLPNIFALIRTRGKDRLGGGKNSRLFIKDETSRGIIHTFTLCIAISVALSFFYPVLALPFFLGYSFHLYSDAFTPEGITPFWPYKKKSTGHVKSGGAVDNSIFYIMIVFAVALLINFFIS